MGVETKFDFGGWATKHGIKCSDGKTIMPNAFEHQDGVTVPLVWAHGHTDPENVLGHAVLENRPDGVYAYAYFNGTQKAVHAKELVAHKDIKALSIWANKLSMKGSNVHHGAIREVSLVMAGANPGALIENVSILHSDGDELVLDDEAIIYTGLTIEHEDSDSKQKDETVAEKTKDNDAEGKTVGDVLDTMTDEQRNVLYHFVSLALDSSDEVEQSDEDDSDELEHEDEDISIEDALKGLSDEDKEILRHSLLATDDNQEGNSMKHNVFESGSEKEETLSHDDMKAIVANAARGGSLRDAVQDYALAHGIEDIEVLFPDHRSVDGVPQWHQRRVEWVQKLMNGVSKSPFARIRTISADITPDEARAKGYTKGNLKKEEFFGVSRRTTGPTTIYKKQKLDRDDVIDITDFDVVAWMKGEMRVMLDEEIARAILIGDGRDVANDDKIDETSIRPIATDHELFTTSINVDVATSTTAVQNIIDSMVLNRRFYRGTGLPLYFTSESWIAQFLLLKDTLGRRIYKSVEEIALELRVSEIITVELLEAHPTIIGVMVNPVDYVVGADRGGEIAMFDDFDIDYNNYKYLIETRISGALNKLKSAIVLKVASPEEPTEVTPAAPTFNALTGVVTIPSTTGVIYEDGLGNDLTAGPQTPIDEDEELDVVAVPSNENYVIASGATTTWTFIGETAL